MPCKAERAEEEFNTESVEEDFHAGPSARRRSSSPSERRRSAMKGRASGGGVPGRASGEGVPGRAEEAEFNALLHGYYFITRTVKEDKRPHEELPLKGGMNFCSRNLSESLIWKDKI